MYAHPVHTLAEDNIPPISKPNLASQSTDQDREDEASAGFMMGRRITYKDYVPLWKNLIDASKLKVGYL